MHIFLVSDSSLVQSNTAKLLNVRVITAEWIQFVMKVVVECRQLMKTDAVSTVRQQIAQVQSAVMSSRAEAWQLTWQQVCE